MLEKTLHFLETAAVFCVLYRLTTCRVSRKEGGKDKLFICRFYIKRELSCQLEIWKLLNDLYFMFFQ
jgi:hypothetical protein